MKRTRFRSNLWVLITLTVCLRFAGALDVTASASDQITLMPDDEGAAPLSYRLVWSAEPGMRYQLQQSQDLKNWTTVAGYPVTASGMAEQYRLQATTNYMFYRVLPMNPESSNSVPGMVWIGPGTFMMGSPLFEYKRRGDELPHTVTISRGFWMGKYEITQEEYQALMGANPSVFTGDLKRPVEYVTWNDATNYCGKLTVQERAAGRLPTGYVYRLPTEAEWEYACRVGTTTATAFGYRLSSTQANFDGNYPYDYGAEGPYLGTTTKVGSYAPNAWGLYDMHGNVWEWCWDWYGSYPGGSVTDPKGPNTGSYHVYRGGSWFNYGESCRSAFRSGSWPDYGNSDVGFRVVLAPGP